MATKMRANGVRSRNVIVDRGLDLAAAGGLHTATVGALANALGMSKSGVFAHFGSKEALDLALIDAAAARFVSAVVAPADAAPAGIAKVAALCEGLLAFVAPGPSSGPRLTPDHPAFGLAVAPAARIRLDVWQAHWQDVLGASVAAAIAKGELAASAETAQVVFELDGVLAAASRAARIQPGAVVTGRARTAIDRVLLASSAG